MYWRTAFLALALSVTPVQAAEQAAEAPRAMSLEDAIAFAREHAPSLSAAKARASAAHADAQVPRAGWLPRVTLGAELVGGTTNNSTTSYVGLPGVDLVRIGSTKVSDTPEWTPYPSTIAAAGLRQEIYDFGRIAAQATALDLQAAAQDRLSDAELLDVELAVTDAFVSVQTAKAVSQAADAAYQRAKVNRDTAAAGVQSGLRKPIELTRADADLLRLDVARVRARASVGQTQALLASVIGAPDAAIDAQGDVPAVPLSGTVNDAISSAQSKDPVVLAARAAADAQRAKSNAYAAQRRPDLMLSASLNTRAGGSPPSSGPVPVGGGFLPDVPNYDVGAVLVWPLLDPVSSAQERAADELVRAREAEVATAEQRVRAAVQQAWLQAQVANEALPALEKSQVAANANLDQARARFNAGLGSALELADAEALLTDAEIGLALGKFEYARARARLSRLTAEGL